VSANEKGDPGMAEPNDHERTPPTAQSDCRKGTLGVCCTCGQSEPYPDDCPKREDGTHCDCWWDGPDLEDAP